METLREGNKIFLPRTPAIWVGTPQYQPASHVTLSFGGGMGGSCQELEVERISFETIANNKFISVKVIMTGEELLINTRNIVKVDNGYTLVFRQYDNLNENFELGPTDTWVRIKNKEIVNYVDKFYHGR